MDLTRITVFCFTASYAVALLLDVIALAGVERPGPLRGVLPRVKLKHLTRMATAAGLFAHTSYLTIHASEQAMPLSSPADWCLLAALVLAALYLSASLAWSRWAVGLFLLPIVLGLIGVSRTASTEPFAPERASLFWGQAHGGLLLGATVSVCLGLVAGLMYLVQSWRLKQKLPPRSGIGLPSLEWLERASGWSLAVSAWLVGGGFLSGLVLSTLKNRGVDGYRLGTDPVVLTLGAMLAWLVFAEVYRIASPASRRGRNVAFLVIASFVLLAVTILFVTQISPVHGTAAGLSLAPADR